MKLSAADWSSALHLLDQALDMAPVQREAWLSSLPAAQQHLREPLLQLLDDRRAIETGCFLGALPPLQSPPDQRGSAFQLGHRIGPYVLLRELGQGGMASVWLAERADGAHGREVALKLPYLGARARVIVERFARERQILSALTHPHIASVLDAGSDAAQPWLAMEYVDGQPITTWADQHQLDVPARLRLFLQVLKAVQHAHAQLVIHRDIKPSNVLVDATGQVKLLDFGVAKLLDDDGASTATELTQLGGRALTPQYAAPEQIAGGSLGTACDVYSLGVLLYELLTGRLPYTLKRATPAALEEAILAAQIGKPSSHASQRRRARALRGDVDTIVLKALQVEPGRRYASAEAFAQDIERHLLSQPILAQPAGAAYRLRKFLKRHGLAVSAGSAVALAVVGGAGVALWQAGHASTQARRAEAVQQFLIKTMSGADPEHVQGRALTARELLDRSAGLIDTEFSQQPDVQASLHHAASDLYFALGDSAKALHHTDRAVQLMEAAGRTNEDLYLDSLSSQVDLRVASNMPGTRELAVRALETIKRARGEPNPWAGNLLSALAWLDNLNGQPAQALAWGEKALAAERAASAGVTERYIDVINTVATVAEEADLKRAHALHAEADRLSSQLPAYPITGRQTIRYNLAAINLLRGDFAAAEQSLSGLMRDTDRHLGRLTNDAVLNRNLRAQVLALLVRYDEAVQLQREAVADAKARPGTDEESVTLQNLTLARVLLRAGHYEEGLTVAREALATMERLHPEPTWMRERLRFDLGQLLLSTGERDHGLLQMRTALDNFARIGGDPRRPSLLNDRLAWAVATRDADASASAAVAMKSCADLRAVLEPDGFYARRCEALAAWLTALAPGGNATAQSAFNAARERLLPLLSPQHPLRAELMAAEAEIVRSTDPSRAASLQARAAVEYRRLFGRELPARLSVLH